MPDRRGPELPVKAKRIIAGVIAAGFLAIISAAFEAHQVQPHRLLFWAVSAGIMGAAKVRFNRINSCYSLGFIVALAAMAALPLVETAAVSVIAILYGRGGFGLVLATTAGIALGFVSATAVIAFLVHDVEKERVRAVVPAE